MLSANTNLTGHSRCFGERVSVIEPHELVGKQSNVFRNVLKVVPLSTRSGPLSRRPATMGGNAAQALESMPVGIVASTETRHHTIHQHAQRHDPRRMHQPALRWGQSPRVREG